MKFKINEFNLNFILMNILFITNLSVFAISSDTEQPIYIESDTQFLDMQENVVTFMGNVVITQGTISVSAEKVIITRAVNKQGKGVIDSYGNPVKFYQMQDNGKPVKGCASNIHYELEKNFIVLTGNAHLEQLDSKITGTKITYLVKEQKMQAYGAKDKRVTTVLLPSQLQDKNH